jgi:D-arabinose 1-dehydrogenase-like Zn-dependent alcohol dehydrogenase
MFMNTNSKRMRNMAISKTMRAVQLVAYKQPLEVREVPVPESRGENVLIRIAGSGLCHSDLHLMEGEDSMAIV